jgi:hypothetical protein
MRHWRAFIVLCIILGVLSALGDAWITGEPPRIIAGIIGTVVSGVGLLCAWFFFLSTGVAGPRMTAWADIETAREDFNNWPEVPSVRRGSQWRSRSGLSGVRVGERRHRGQRTIEVLKESCNERQPAAS